MSSSTATVFDRKTFEEYGILGQKSWELWHQVF